ncbi:MAG: VOC family protein [Bacteroidota bacterium]
MTGPFVSRVGGVLSADIAVPEYERAMRFYARVLSTGKQPLWRTDLLNNQGVPIIGLGQRDAAHANLPIQWMPHIQVANIAESVTRALALGGSELMHGRDADGQSQWAVLCDPNGAAFGLIPAVDAEVLPTTGDDALAQVGYIAWLDLTVTNASATRDFYRQVVGWSVQDVEMDDGGAFYVDYNMIGGDGHPVAGICHARGVNRDLPSTWMMYLPVNNLNESTRRVREEGGAVIKTIHGADGELTHAIVEDPVGAYLALVAGGYSVERPLA